MRLVSGLGGGGMGCEVDGWSVRGPTNSLCLLNLCAVKNQSNTWRIMRLKYSHIYRLSIKLLVCQAVCTQYKNIGTLRPYKYIKIYGPISTRMSPMYGALPNPELIKPLHADVNPVQRATGAIDWLVKPTQECYITFMTDYATGPMLNQAVIMSTEYGFMLKH